MPQASLDFDGTAAISGLSPAAAVFPADPSGAAGPDNYVQTTNFSYTIFAKDGSVLCGPWSTNTFWQSLGAPCNTFVSDAVVLFDRDAGRWFVSRFGISGDAREEADAPAATASSDQCFAISDTSDPTRSWQLYQFDVSRQYFADYPKFGIWPDAYYMTANANKIFSRTGVIAVAFDRVAMLAGRADAKMVEFFVAAQGRKFGMLPADRDGPAPPPRGAPGIFVQPRDTHLGFAPPDGLGIWSFHVDWTTPLASTFTMTSLETEPFNSNICGGSQECIPQAGTTQTLDSLAYGYLMYRVAYRNFGDHESIVLNQTVDAGQRAGIRWYELRRQGPSGWTIRQQETYAPDANWRWMGSIAMDGAGDIAMGFSVSNGEDLLPSLRYVGRLAGDPPNSLDRTETDLIAAGGARTDGASLWSDWSQLTVDPVDDCTFWHTGEYMASPQDGAINLWRTRVGAFKFAECPAAPTPAPEAAAAEASATTARPARLSATGDQSDSRLLAGLALVVLGLVGLRHRRRGA
jgi:hypothetical protein